MLNKLGYDVVLAAYPDFRRLFVDLQTIRDRIVESRRDRENREAIYSAIEDANFPSLVIKFNDMKLSESIMTRMARRNRIRDLIGWAGLIFGIIGVLIALLAYL